MYTIGQFSKIGFVTKKTLRFYDKIGLLEPAYVDEVNNYRYYTHDQILPLVQINELKEYGLTLEEIKLLLEKQDNFLLEQALLGKLNEMDKNLHELQRNKERLKQRLQVIQKGGVFMEIRQNVQIEVKEKEEITVAYVRKRINLNEIDLLFAELGKQVIAADLTIVGAWRTVYHSEDFDPENVDVEVCAPVSYIDQPKGVKTRIFPGGSHACATHVGAYGGADFGSVYTAIGKWVPENGYSFARPPFEIYLVGPDNTDDPEKYVTEICFPINKAE